MGESEKYAIRGKERWQEKSGGCGNIMSGFISMVGVRD